MLRERSLFIAAADMYQRWSPLQIPISKVSFVKDCRKHIY